MTTEATTATPEVPAGDAPTAPIAAPEAPKEAPPTPAPAKEAEGPKTAREALQQARDRARGNRTREEPARPGTETVPRDDRGRFAKEDAASSDPPPDAAVASGDAPTGAPKPEGPPEGYVRITLPENHPLAHRTKHLDFPAEQEEYGRWAVNQAVRNAELDQARQAEREARRQIEATRAEADFWRDAGQEFFGPEFRQTYEDLKQAYGEAHAERYKNGVMQQAQEKVRERQQERMLEVQKEELTNQALRFRQLAVDDAREKFPHWSDADVEKALQHYGAWVATNRVDQLSAKDWYNIARTLYMQHPRVQAEVREIAARKRQEQESKIRENVKAEAAASEAQRLKDVAASRRSNPFGRMPNAQTGASPDAPSDGRPTTAREAKEMARRRARGLA